MRVGHSIWIPRSDGGKTKATISQIDEFKVVVKWFEKDGKVMAKDYSVSELNAIISLQSQTKIKSICLALIFLLAVILLANGVISNYLDSARVSFF
jgi:hypothetical protein